MVPNLVSVSHRKCGKQFGIIKRDIVRLYDIPFAYKGLGIHEFRKYQVTAKLVM